MYRNMVSVVYMYMS